MKRIFYFLISIISVGSIAAQTSNSGLNRWTNLNEEPTKHEIGFGLENYSKTDDINGGNHLYLEYHYQLRQKVAIGGKFSSDLAPYTFEDVFASAGIRFNTTAIIDKFGQTIAFNYIYNFNEKKTNQDFIGVDISLITFYADNTFEMDFLPVSVLYSIGGEDLSIIYKFLGIKINF